VAGRAVSTSPTRVPLGLAAATVVVAAALGTIGAMVVHTSLAHSPAPALPELHGQTTWAPGSRPAPASVPRGRPAAVAFLGTGCASCLAELRWTIRHLPAAERPAVVVAPAAAAASYGVTPGRRVLLLVDRRGYERTGYAFPFVPPFVQDDLSRLADER
jgi:hypothetical protein